MKSRSYLAGKARLPGRTDPKRPKDTIPAVLSPGEAVLNAPAAAKLGRAKITALNRDGNASRGTDAKGAPLRKTPRPENLHEQADRLHPVRKNA